MYILKNISFNDLINKKINDNHKFIIEYITISNKKAKKVFKRSDKIYLDEIKKISRAIVGYGQSWKNVLHIVNSKIIINNDTMSSKELVWQWNDESNKKPIEMTVALPALNANKIIWLALESLKNQINITFAWELIVFEEEGVSKEIVQSYAGLLPGCVRIIYKTITIADAYYKIEDIKKKKCTSYYTLLEKWINMAKTADKNSKVFVKHAVDCYSPPKRLFIHYEHFKNDMCYYSTQPKGYFYNIHLKKYFLYDGIKIEPYNWKKYYSKNKLKYKTSLYDKNIIFRGCHLNMALRTEIMKQIPLPKIPKRKSLDGYILYYNTKISNVNPEQKKIVFTDDEIDKENWKFSIDTDGYNHISKSRSNAYNFLDKERPHCIPVNKTENKIPNYIMHRLLDLK